MRCQEELKNKEELETLKEKLKKKQVFLFTIIFFLIEIGWEEYYDYIFPDDDNQLRNIKILEKARRWKEMMAAKNKGTADENPEEIADV